MELGQITGVANEKLDVGVGFCFFFGEFNHFGREVDACNLREFLREGWKKVADAATNVDDG